MKPRIALLAGALILLTSCGGGGQAATATGSPGPAAAASGLLTPVQARGVFGRFLAAFRRAEAARTRAAAATVLAGPELEDQNFQPGINGPEVQTLTDERVYVPRLTAYPYWFLATGRPPQGGSGTGFIFLLVQSAPRAPWLDAAELFGFGQPGFMLPDLSRVALDARGYATAVQPGDASLAVPPAGLSAGFSRYFDAAVSHQGTAPAGYTSNLVPGILAAARAAPRYGWRVFDTEQPRNSPVYALRLAGGGAAVLYLTGESTGWQAASAATGLSAPQAAFYSGAAPPPQITQKLHLTSVRPGLRIVGTLVDEHLAMDPPRGGVVADYFNGKSTGWTVR